MWQPRHTSNLTRWAQIGRFSKFYPPLDASRSKIWNAIWFGAVRHTCEHIQRFFWKWEQIVFILKMWECWFYLKPKHESRGNCNVLVLISPLCKFQTGGSRLEISVFRAKPDGHDYSKAKVWISSQKGTMKFFIWELYILENQFKPI